MNTTMIIAASLMTATLSAETYRLDNLQFQVPAEYPGESRSPGRKSPANIGPTIRNSRQVNVEGRPPVDGGPNPGPTSGGRGRFGAGIALEDHGRTWSGHPRALQGGEERWPRPERPGRIGENPGERPLESPAVEEGDRIPLHEAAAVGDPEAPRVLPDRHPGLPPGFDEDRLGGPAAERLEPERPGPRVGVEDPPSGEPLPQEVEQGLADPVGGRPHPRRVRDPQATPLQLPRNDPQEAHPV